MSGEDGRPTRGTIKGREDQPYVREGSGGPPDPSRTCWRVSRPHPDFRVDLPDLRMGLPTPAQPLGGPPDPSRTSGRSSRPLTGVSVGLPTSPSHPDKPPNPSQTCGWAFQIFR